MSVSNIQQLVELPYFNNSADLFAAIEAEPWAVFLDSGFPYSEQGRYDILSANPDITLVTHGQLTTITTLDGESVSVENPFDLIKPYLDRTCKTESNLPFNGGLLGYFSYDLARRLEKLPVIAKDEEQIAEMAVGIYPWAVVVDHLKQQSFLVGQGIDAVKWQALIQQFSQLSSSILSDAFHILTAPVSNMTQSRYAEAFDRIKWYLTEGDSYQVNLAQRFASRCSGNPWVAYQALRQMNPAPFGAYLNLPEVQLLSSSPERFLKVSQGAVETKPIKGTRPRLADNIADQQQMTALAASHKDRAENVMIVDLLRNDMSKNCQQGSVKVPHLFDVESFATVHHLVSTVTGQLSTDDTAIDLLKNCFPGGSITGAPKIRAMEIIEELEPNRRGIYCGSMGYIGFNGNMDTNIAIRTLVHSDHIIRFWAGGGIVNDSVMQDEYQESFDKAAALLQLLKQFEVACVL